jgi:hypothetical protein
MKKGASESGNSELELRGEFRDIRDGAQLLSDNIIHLEQEWFWFVLPSLIGQLGIKLSDSFSKNRLPNGMDEKDE